MAPYDPISVVAIPAIAGLLAGVIAILVVNAATRQRATQGDGTSTSVPEIDSDVRQEQPDAEDR